MKIENFSDSHDFLGGIVPDRFDMTRISELRSYKTLLIMFATLVTALVTSLVINRYQICAVSAPSQLDASMSYWCRYEDSNEHYGIAWEGISKKSYIVYFGTLAYTAGAQMIARWRKPQKSGLLTYESPPEPQTGGARNLKLIFSFFFRCLRRQLIYGHASL